MKLLVTGSDGLVGTNILPFLKEEFEVFPFVESEWDITDPKRSDEVIGSVKPDVLLNLAGMTDVDGCEEKAALAFRVNGEAAGILAEACARHGSAIVYFSTDYVFDGTKSTPYTEADPTNPLSVYGRSKRMGEERTMVNPRSLVIRTEWIYGKGGESFISKVVRAARERGIVEVVNDQTGAPTYAPDLARPVAALIRGAKTGIYHVTNSDSCTWYNFARHVFSVLQLGVECRPTTSDRFKRRATRPAYSVLDCGRLRKDAGIEMRSWQQAVEEYLNTDESAILFRRTPPR